MCYFKKFGFPLDFNREHSTELSNSDGNHASANQYPEEVQCYLDTEVENGAIYGPFEHKPYGASTHISPFMSRPKGANERRIIIDLSWPKEASVNTFTQSNSYFNTIYKLQYPMVDSITDQLK